MHRFRIADASSLALSSLLIAAILVWAAINAFTMPEKRTAGKPVPSPANLARSYAPELEKAGRIVLPPPPQALAPAVPWRPAAATATKRENRTARTMFVSPLSPKTRPAAPTPRAKPVARHSRPRPTPPEPPHNSKPEELATDAANPTTAGRAVTAKPDDRPGRELLRLLEHGNGPSIEIAWPSRREPRIRLYRRLTACYGMRAAIMDKTKRLFAEGSPPRSPWQLNADLYSGFLRLPQGLPVAVEARVFSRLAAFHGLESWQPVRVFPRPVDAALLGGLERLIGARYRKARTITAAYELRKNALVLSGIVVDGQPVAGRVRLAAGNCR